MITKMELLRMLSDTESYNIERTESTGNMDKFCQAICAFSNDISGSGKNGYLIIGAKNNGELSGLQVDDKLLLQIANIRTDGNILPQPIMTVEKFSFEGGRCIGGRSSAFRFSSRALSWSCLGACGSSEKHCNRGGRKDTYRKAALQCSYL